MDADVVPAEARSDAAGVTPALRDEKLPLRRVRALVVDDDRDSLELIRVVLEEAGAKVVGVPSAQAAIDERGRFDVIISDIGMPEVDGYALMRTLRAQSGTACVPAIALTSYARLEDAERALEAGYQQHVAKPVDSAELVSAVQRLIQAAR
jgi:CheY-like chemotaxis protein